MKKEAILLLVLFFCVTVLAATFTTITQTNFDQGTYVNSVYNTSSSAVEISNQNLSGNYTSEIFDATSSATWSEISWVQGACYGCELPANSTVETSFGKNINMSSNTLLLHLNENSGTFNDSSGLGRNFTADTNVGYSQEGIFENSAGFDGGAGAGVDSNLNTGNFVTASSATLSLWAYINGSAPTRTTSYQGEALIGMESSRYIGIYRAIIGEEDKVWAYNWDGNEDRVGVGYTPETWHHFVLVHSGGTLYLYKDGSLSGSIGSGNTQSLASNLLIGAQNFEGKIDEVATFNRSLSAQEIKAMYERGAISMNLSVRSCDDSNCENDAWQNLTLSSPQSLSINNNQYFQYLFTYSRLNSSVTSQIHNVSITYEAQGGSSSSSSGGGDPVPEWEDYALLLILVMVIGGFYQIKKLQ